MAQTITDEQLAAPDFEAADMKIETVSPRRGRKPIKGAAARGGVSAEVVEAELAAAPAVAEIRANTMSMPKSELAQSLHLAKTVGSIAAFQFNEAVNRVAALKAFAEIRENKAYKGLSVQNETTGEVVTVNTWEEFCNAHGYSYRKIAEDLQNLAIFGGGLLEMQEALGLGYRDLRLLRKGVATLPPEERRAILDEVKNADGPEELKDKLADLRTELAEAERKERELSATLKAKEAVSKEKSVRIEKLETDLARLKSMEPDDQAKALREMMEEACRGVDEKCLAVFVAVMDLASTCAAVLSDERSDERGCAWVHERVSVMVAQMAAALKGAGLDVDPRAEFALEGFISESDEEAAATAEAQTAAATADDLG